jgi:hypothetical protein
MYRLARMFGWLGLKDEKAHPRNALHGLLSVKHAPRHRIELLEQFRIAPPCGRRSTHRQASDVGDLISL